jgi:hypothetical protein
MGSTVLPSNRIALGGRRCAPGNGLMKFAADGPLSDPEKAARKLIEIANSVEAVQDSRVHIEKINGPFLYKAKGSPAEYLAGIKLAIDRGWPTPDRSGTYVKFTQAGADLFA